MDSETHSVMSGKEPSLGLVAFTAGGGNGQKGTSGSEGSGAPDGTALSVA